MIRMIRKFFLATAAVTVGFVTLTSIGCIGSKDDTCRAGDNCECNGIGSCNNECDGGGCSFVCKGLGSCDFTCEQGGCEAFCKGEGSCNLSCPGGDCVMFCTGAGSCNISDCPNDSCDIR
jgi:hypothetical protein